MSREIFRSERVVVNEAPHLAGPDSEVIIIKSKDGTDVTVHCLDDGKFIIGIGGQTTLGVLNTFPCLIVTK